MFGIQTGVAIGFFVREESKLGRCGIHYVHREDAELATDKLSYLRMATLDDVEFESITPDKRSHWLNQSDSGFEGLTPLANRETKFAKNVASEQAVFGLFTNAVKSNRDEWVYDFEVSNLRDKVLFFADTYNGSLDSNDKSYNPVIKWSRDLRNEYRRGRRVIYNDANRIMSLYRPFVVKHHFADFTMNDVLTGNHYEMFGADLKQRNRVINFCVNGKRFTRWLPTGPPISTSQGILNVSRFTGTRRTRSR